MGYWKIYEELKVQNYLVSYWYDKNVKLISTIRKSFPKSNIILDSGAFSAMTQGLVIDVDEYIEFCHKHK
jgi:hypothetical protein